MVDRTDAKMQFLVKSRSSKCIELNALFLHILYLHSLGVRSLFIMVERVRIFLGTLVV